MPPDGGLVEVRDTEDRFIGHGLYNGASDIRIRMLARGRRTDLRQAARVPAAAPRLVHPPAAQGPAARRGHGRVPPRARRGRRPAGPRRRSLRRRHRVRAPLARLLELARGRRRLPARAPAGVDGRPPHPELRAQHRAVPGRGAVRPAGAGALDPRARSRFPVAPGASHKTGWFCDQRDNRRLVAEYARGRDVLDLCCHAGGFALAAARAGAHSVTRGRPRRGAARARRCARRASRTSTVRFEHADAFNVLRRSRPARDARGSSSSTRTS